MYTLGIPDRQKRRTLGYLKQSYIDFEERPSMEGFFDVSFPGMDEDAFRDIVMKLKQQGVTVIGADEKLTERKMKKLTDLMNEQALGYTSDIQNYPLGDDEGPSQGFHSDELKDILIDLKNILHTWQTKQYADDKSRWEEYYMDIDELVTDFEEEAVMDRPTSYALQEEKLRKVIRKMIRQ